MKSYIDEELLAKLSQIPLKPISFAEGLFKGHHRSRQSGEETDFKEFRHYIMGDDLKKIDWKRSARLNNFFVKEFEEELNYKIQIILDSSSSMIENSNSKINKNEYSKYLTMGLAYLFLKQGDQVQVLSFNETILNCFNLNQTIKNINILDENLKKIQPEKRGNLKLIENSIKSGKSDKWIIIIFSDFVYPLDDLFQTLTRINHPKNKIVLFQLNNDHDLNFPFKGEIEFVNPETGEVFFSNTSEIKDKFLSKWREFNHAIGKWSREKAIEFHRMNCSDNYSDNLLQFIKLYHNKGN